MSLPGATDFDKLAELAKKPYKDQGVWFLNAFWRTMEADAETLWKFVQKFVQLDSKGVQGNEVDEMQMHRFLEAFSDTMTVREMRDNLRDTGAVKGNMKAFSLVHYLILKYKSDWHVLVNASQGDNREEVEKAQQLLNAVQAAFQDAQAKADEAKKREDESIKREEELKAAKAELEAALQDLKNQEEAYATKTATLKAKSEDETIGLVSRNKAKNELAQHLSEDPLPLRKAKITQEAAVKKADKATQVAADARTAAESARVAAEKSLEEAQKKVDETQAYVDEVKNRPGSAQGSMWWIDRELHEAKAYLPQKKGGYRK